MVPVPGWAALGWGEPVEREGPLEAPGLSLERAVTRPSQARESVPRGLQEMCAPRERQAKAANFSLHNNKIPPIRKARRVWGPRGSASPLRPVETVASQAGRDGCTQLTFSVESRHRAGKGRGIVAPRPGPTSDTFGAWTHSQANVFPRRRSLAANLLRAQLLLPGRPAPGAVTPAGSTLPTPSLSESKPDCRFRKKEPKAPFSERPLLHLSDSSYSDWGKKGKKRPCRVRATGNRKTAGERRPFL